MMSDFNEIYNINICKDKCNFICIMTEYSPNGHSYYKCSKCDNTLMKKNINKDNFLQSETTRRK